MFTELKKEILKNGGATLTKNFKNADLKFGFMVSIQGYEFTTKNIDEAINKGLEYKELIKNKDGYYIGFWVDNGLIYVDISKQVSSLRDAKQFGKKNLQKGVFDIKRQKTIYLDYEIKFYSVYKIIKDRYNNIIDEVFYKQFDTMKAIPRVYREYKDRYKIYTDHINITDM